VAPGAFESLDKADRLKVVAFHPTPELVDRGEGNQEFGLENGG
jgi:hypothetical protein